MPKDENHDFGVPPALRQKTPETFRTKMIEMHNPVQDRRSPRSTHHVPEAPETNSAGGVHDG